MPARSRGSEQLGGGQHPRHPRLPGQARAQGRQGRSRLLVVAALERRGARRARSRIRPRSSATDTATVKAWARRPRLHLRSRRATSSRSSLGLVLADTLPAQRRHGVPHARPCPAVRAPTSVRSRTCYQTVLEVERDGDRPAGPVPLRHRPRPARVRRPARPARQRRGLSWPWDSRLEGKSCASPVGTTAAEWQIAGRKIWNWGEKNQHIRDARVVADELLAEPAVAALVPKMRALPAQRVAVIGHSFTMDLHWSSPSAFVPIVTAMFARENPKVEFRQFQGGGLTSTRAYNRFFPDVLAWKPDRRAAGRAQPHGRGPPSTSRAVGKRSSACGGARLQLRRPARSGHDGSRALAKEWATGRASGHHDRRGVAAPVRGPRPRALRVPGRDPHDGALASPDGEGVAQAAGRRARPAPGELAWRSRSFPPRRRWRPRPPARARTPCGARFTRGAVPTSSRRPGPPSSSSSTRW